MGIQVDDTIRDALLTEGIDLADHHQLTSYDVAYLQLAKKVNSTLATLDRRLALAAKAEGIPVFGE